jgi:hypothetical protein
VEIRKGTSGSQNMDKDMDVIPYSKEECGD